MKELWDHRSHKSAVVWRVTVALSIESISNGLAGLYFLHLLDYFLLSQYRSSCDFGMAVSAAGTFRYHRSDGIALGRPDIPESDQPTR